MRLKLEIEIPCSAEKYWRMIYDEPFEKFQGQLLGLEDTFENSSYMDKTNGVCLKRVVTVCPNVKLPSVVKKLVGDRFSYKEIQEKRLDRCETKWKTIPPFYPDQVTSEGVVYLEPIDDTKCKQVLDAEFGSSFGWGFAGIFENIISSELKKTYEKIPDTVSKYLAHVEETGYDVDAEFAKMIKEKKKEWKARQNEGKSVNDGQETETEKAERLRKQAEAEREFHMEREMGKQVV